jgi:hypothetical protein
MLLSAALSALIQRKIVETFGAEEPDEKPGGVAIATAMTRKSENST